MDALSNLGRELFGLDIVNLISANNHAELAAGLNGIGLDDSGIRERELLEVVEALDVSLHNFATSAGASAGDCIADLHNGSQERRLLYLVVVGADGIAYVGFLFLLLGKFHTQESVWQLGLFVRHFAYVVEQTGAASLFGVEAELAGHDGAKVGGLTRVLQEVLTIA